MKLHLLSRNSWRSGLKGPHRANYHMSAHGSAIHLSVGTFLFPSPFLNCNLIPLIASFLPSQSDALCLWLGLIFSKGSLYARFHDFSFMERFCTNRDVLMDHTFIFLGTNRPRPVIWCLWRSKSQMYIAFEITSDRLVSVWTDVPSCVMFRSPFLPVGTIGIEIVRYWFFQQEGDCL